MTLRVAVARYNELRSRLAVWRPGPGGDRSCWQATEPSRGAGTVGAGRGHRSQGRLWTSTGGAHSSGGGCVQVTDRVGLGGYEAVRLGGGTSAGSRSRCDSARTAAVRVLMSWRPRRPTDSRATATKRTRYDAIRAVHGRAAAWPAAAPLWRPFLGGRKGSMFPMLETACRLRLLRCQYRSMAAGRPSTESSS